MKTRKPKRKNRPGAGRPPLVPGQKIVSGSISLSRENWAKLDALVTPPIKNRSQAVASLLPDKVPVTPPSKPDPKLKIWNGRGHGREWDRGHFFVCAPSRRVAARLLCLAAHPLVGAREDLVGQMDRELRDYYSKDCWGNTMDGITPEIGVWATKGNNDKPVKIVDASLLTKGDK